MHLRRFVLFVLLLPFTLSRSTPAEAAVDAAKLRAAASLPQIDVKLNMQFRFDRVAGFVVNETKPVPAVEIAQLRQQMNGSVEDAERLLRLAAALQSSNDVAGAVKAREQALKFRQDAVKQHPNDGFAHTQLALALAALERSPEAEAEMRRAQELSPGDWRVWSEWGEFRLGQIKPGTSTAGEVDLGEQQTHARELLDGVKAAHDKAVQLAPENPEPYIRRAMFQMSGGLLRLWIEKGMPKQWQGSEQEMASSLAMWPRMQADMLQAARLEREPRQASGLWLFQGYYKVLSGLQKTETASESEKAENLEAVEALMRLAMALDPHNAAAPQALACVFLMNNRFDELAILLEEQMKRSDTPFQRVFLAKAYAKLERYDKAQFHISAALKNSPHDFLANLTQAALWLRLDDSSAMQRAGALLDTLQNATETREGKSADDYHLLRGIYWGLTGEVAEARHLLQPLATADPSDQVLAQALGALGAP